MAEATKSEPSMKRMILILIFLCLGCILQGSTYTHLSSFFNIYAFENKALSSSAYGVIMGSFCLMFIIVPPTIAKVVSSKKFKDKTILFFGWILDSVLCMIMSQVGRLGSGAPFFLGSLGVRIVEAVGCSTGFFMIFVVIGSEMNEINHIALPLIETTYGISTVLGPAFAGILYDKGGFQLPSLVIGGCLLGLTFLGMLALPKPKKVEEEEESKSPGLKVVWRFQVIVNVLCTMNAFMMISFNESTLALRLKQMFDMTVAESGVMFLFVGGTYALSGLVFGFVSKKVNDARYFVVMGQVFIVAALSLLAPLMPITQTKGVIILSQLLLGLGVGPIFLCSYLQSLNFLSNGKNVKETYAALSAIFTPVSSIGSMAGPLVAGILMDHYPYNTVVVVNFVQTVFAMIMLIGTIIYDKRINTVRASKECDQVKTVAV